MTRTEQDLRTLLHSPVDPDAAARVLAGVTGADTGSRRASSARGWRVGMVTALAVVLVVGAVLAVVAVRPGDRAAPTPAGTSQAPPTSTAPAEPVALSLRATVVSFVAGSGYAAGATMLFPGDQSVDAVPAGGDAAVATVHVGDGPARARVAGRPAVDLGGGVAATWVVSEAGAGGVTTVPDALSWTVDGVVVTVEPTFDGATDAIVEAVARAVVVGAPSPVRVPVSVSSWPAGWILAGLVSTYTHRDGATGAAGRDVLVDIGVDGDTNGTAVTIDSGGIAFGGNTSTGSATELGGRLWHWDPTSDTYTWAGPDRFVRVTSLNAGIGATELRALVSSLSLATDFADESTWFDAPAAFPS